MHSRPLPDVREGLSTPPETLEGPPDLPRYSGMASKPFPELWVSLRPLPDLQKRLPTPPGTSVRLTNSPRPLRGPAGPSEGLQTPPGPPNPFRTSRRASRPLCAQKGLMTSLGPSGGSPRPPEGPHDPFRPTRRALQPLPALREGLPTPPAFQEGLPSLPNPLGGPHDPSQTSERAF